MYPSAGEASWVWTNPEGSTDPDAWSRLEEEDRQRLNRERADRRAKSQTRRYFASNGLRYMWVLTLAGEGLHGPEGRKEAMRLVAEFIHRRLAPFVGEDFAYWYGPELHPGGHGWHVNLFVAQRLNHADISRLWGHGFVWVTDWARHPAAKSVRDGVRMGARYGCKYATKDWGAEVVEDGCHRYELAQGFQPEKIGRWGKSRAYVEALVLDVFGRLPEYLWDSESLGPDYSGPPIVWAAWEDGGG